MASIFISDLHFGLLSPETEKVREKKFVEFVNFAKNECDQFFILGDLFDYWFEYRHVIQKGYFRTFTAISDMVEAGIKVHYLIGNHDFMHRDFFEKEIGVKLYENELKIEIDSKKFFLAHGDGLVENDLGYKILKKVLRNKNVQKIYSLIHPDLGIWLASSSSKTSRNYTAQKSYGEIDGLLNAAKKIIDDGFDYVLFGHSHEQKKIIYKNGQYINLGTWLDKPCYGIYKNQNFEIIEWNS
ncbi:MAG: UDP-2,3-diacylglucosamine diphosphatase [Melioribacteraceae bacterium]